MLEMTEGEVTIVRWSVDPLCLRCWRHVATDHGYNYEVSENRTSYFMCWDCAPSEWQREVIDWEATIHEDDRLLS